ncbi:RICIN domain-containing protein [Streptomyces sp. x-19]|uniref:RICIN domain-containing protein n=1 Tax=Streptomyces sp. x-19 TaxID=2789280 RepID=UPI0039800904
MAIRLAPHQSTPGDRPPAQGPLSSSASPSPSPSASAASRSPETPSPSPATPAPGPHGTDGPAPTLPQPPAPTETPNPTPGGGSNGHSNPTRLSPGSSSHLENVAARKCVAGDGAFLSIGSCGASYVYTWKLLPTGGDTFELVNRASGSCLTAPQVNNVQASLTPNCSSGNNRWRIDTTSAAGQTVKSAETDHCLEIDSPFSAAMVMVTTCNSDDPKQLWRGGGAG